MQSDSLMPSPYSLRILFLASRDDGHPEMAGGDLQLSGLAAMLASRGHRITYACIRRPGVPSAEIRNDVTIVRGPGAQFQAAWAAWMYTREWARRTDIVVEEAVGALPVPYAAPVYVRHPLVAFWYQVNAPLFREQFSPVVAAALTSLERGLARLHATAVIATPSEFQAARLRRLGFRPDQVRVVPIGLDWPFVPPPPLSAREPLIVYLGRLRRYKCPHHLLAVAQRLNATSPAAKVVIAGRPDRTGYDRWLETEITRLGLRGRVILTRSISDEAKRDLVRRARVLVVPSPAEGFGFVVLEANWGGTPVVATTGAPSEVIQEGRNGLRVPFGDTAALAAAIGRLLQDDAQWTRMSRGAWDTWQNYPWAAATSKLEVAMAEAIRRKRERRASEPNRTAPCADAGGRGFHAGAVVLPRPEETSS
jgi:glycosyltransferase involved in cell wall biosynthesis